MQIDLYYFLRHRNTGVTINLAVAVKSVHNRNIVSTEIVLFDNARGPAGRPAPAAGFWIPGDRKALKKAQVLLASADNPHGKNTGVNSYSVLNLN